MTDRRAFRELPEPAAILVPPSIPPRPEAFPVGALFLSVEPGNPAEVLGYGVWVEFGQGRVLVGILPGDPDFGTAGHEAGSKTADHQHSYSQVVAHTHPVTVTDPGHQHDADIDGGVVLPGMRSVAGSADSASEVLTDAVRAAETGISVAVGNPDGSVATGTTSSAAVSTLQPYVVVHIWRRVS